jgi:hypothetical protein
MLAWSEAALYTRQGKNSFLVFFTKVALSWGSPGSAWHMDSKSVALRWHDEM